MASKLVLEALESLHHELDKMKPAIKQVELAEQVIGEARKIPEHYLKLVTRIEGQETNFKQKLVSDLNGHADQVKKEVGTLIASADITITNLTKHEEQFGAMRKSLEPLISQLASLGLQPRLDKLQDTADRKFDQLTGSTNLLQTGVKGIQDRLNTTELTIGNRLTEEGKTRRDQLEANANTIKLEVRQLTDKLQLLESVMVDQIRDQGKKQDERINTLSAEVSVQIEGVKDSIGQMTAQVQDRFGQLVSQLELIHKQQAEQKTFTYITWFLIAAATAALFFVKHS